MSKNCNYLEPDVLFNCLKAMAILDIIMIPKKDDWLRVFTKYQDEEAFCIDNGAGDTVDIVFEDNGVFMKGFDHENKLNQFGADQWDDEFFKKTYKDVPTNFLEIFEEEALEYMTFCMWYSYEDKSWHQNETEGNGGGKDFLLGYIFENAESWKEWADYYYKSKVNIDIVRKAYHNEQITADDILSVDKERDAVEALEEIAQIDK